MANLTYRSPVEDVISHFTSEENSKISQVAVNSIRDNEIRQHDFFNYALPQKAKEKLNSAGIYLSPYSYKPHSHPVCKTLENHMLYNVVPDYIDNSFYMVGIKDSKINFLKARNPKVKQAEVINRFVTSKDLHRYPNFFVNFHTNNVPNLWKNKGISGVQSLVNKLPAQIKERRRNLFLHDELHYWCADDYMAFLDLVEPEKLIGTLVFPPEILAKSRNSLNPWAYSYKIKDNDLIFMPDGVGSEAYIQPLHGGSILKISNIITPKGKTYAVNLLHSKFCHHLIAITRCDLPSEKYRLFNNFDAINIAELTTHSRTVVQAYPIEYRSVSKIYRYLMTLRKPDLQSATAKLSQIIPEPTAFEIKFTQEFSTLVLSTSSINSLLTKSVKDEIGNFFVKIFPKRLTECFSGLKSIVLDNFLSSLEPFNFLVELKVMKVGFLDVFDFCDDFNEMHYADPIESMRKFDEGSNPDPYHKHSGYMCKGHWMTDKGVFDLFTLVGAKEMAKMIYEIFKQSFSSLNKEGIKWMVDEIFKVKASTSSFKRLLCQFSTDKNFRKELEARFSKKCYHGCINNKRFAFNGLDVLVSLLWFSCQRRVNVKYITLREGRGVNDSVEQQTDKVSVKDYDINQFKRLKSCMSELKKTFKDKESKKEDKTDKENGGVKEKRVESEGKVEEKKECNDLDFDLEDLFPELEKDNIKKISEDKIFHEPEKAPISKKKDAEVQKKKNLKENEAVASKDKKEWVRKEKDTEEATHEDCSSSSSSLNSSNCFSAFNIHGIEVKVYNKSPQNYAGKRTQVIGDGNCFWRALSIVLGEESSEIKKKTYQLNFNLISEDKKTKAQFEENAYAESEAIALFCKTYSFPLFVINASNESFFLYGSGTFGYPIFLEDEHFEPILQTNDCVLQAIRSSISMTHFELFKQLINSQTGHVLLNELFEGSGLSINLIVLLIKHFEMNAQISFEGTNYNIEDGTGPIHSFTIEDDHMTYDGELISRVPIKEKVNFKEDVALEMTLMRSCSKIEYIPNAFKATTLSDSFYQGYTGVLLSRDNGEKKELVDGVNLHAIANSFVYTLLGTFGSGKSFFYKDITKKFKDVTFTIISPRKKLCDNLNHDLGLSIPTGSRLDKRKKKKDNRIILCTFEVFFKNFEVNSKSSIIILDEVQLFPPGFLDLLMVKLNTHSKIILCGDPCQSDYDSQKDRHLFMNSNSDISEVLDKKEYKYNIVSRRFRNRNFLNRLPCNIHGITQLKERDLVYVNSIDELKNYKDESLEVILVSSFEEKKIAYLAYRNQISVMTFGESTGLTFNFGAILVTYESIKTSDNRWITALSRFRNNLAIVNLTGAPFSELPQMFLGRPLHHFLTTQSSLAYFHDNLPGEPKFIYDFQGRVGFTGAEKEEKLKGDPWLKALLFLGDDINIEDEQVIEEVYNEECFKTHIPNVNLATCFVEIHDKIRAREFREVRMGTELSTQFTDEHYKGMGEKLTNAAERFETIYPRHKGTDTVTFLMAVKKRLKFSDPAKEDQKLRKAMIFGEFLLSEFLKICPLDGRHDQFLMEAANKEFEEKKLSKPASTIENHSARSCSDWLADVALIFMKSQLCTKYEKRFVDAKAGQTLACFHHSVLCRFAPYIRYIEKKMNEKMPDRFYIHSGKNFDDLNEYVKRQGFNDMCTESDYEAFDASQDFYILAFELKLMEYLGLPRSLIHDYRYIKIHLGSKLGNFAIMRFTGEASTFLFNTMANMLFTQLRYDIPKSASICFAGDDMCANYPLKIKSEHENFLKKISLKAKVSRTIKPTFCGWFLTKYGILKNPKLVLERMCIARERNNVANCLDSYAIEASYAYKMSEKLYDILDESEMNAHHCCVRYIVQNKNLLVSNLAILTYSGLKFESLV